MDMNIINEATHIWPLAAGPLLLSESEANIIHKTAAETLTGSLAGITWRSPHVHKWLLCKPEELEAHVAAQVSNLGAISEPMLSAMRVAARHVANWLDEVCTFKDQIGTLDQSLKPMVDLGLKPMSRQGTVKTSMFRPESNFTNLFHLAITSLQFLDSFFWVHNPASFVSSETHPIYSIATLEVAENHTAQLCRRLYRWEDCIISPTEADRQPTASNQRVEVMGLGVSKALLHLCGMGASWQWGKVLKNCGALAMGLRLLYGAVRGHWTLPNFQD
jgi:hypothetical protein